MGYLVFEIAQKHNVLIAELVKVESYITFHRKIQISKDKIVVDTSIPK